MPDPLIVREKERLVQGDEINLPRQRPKLYFLCLGNEQLPFDRQTYYFGTSGDLSKHLRRKAPTDHQR
jgi:hypothetical protein